MRMETLGMVRDHLKKIKTFAHHYELYRARILPLARQTVQSNQIGYESDTTGFLQLITAQRFLQEAESAYLNHLTAYLIAVAEFEAFAGIEPGGPMRSSILLKKDKTK